MIQINDNDLPIQVAEKIIGGTKEVPTNISGKALQRALYRAFTGEELEETISTVMFNLEEIKEIADHLMVYYEAHKN